MQKSVFSDLVSLCNADDRRPGQPPGNTMHGWAGEFRDHVSTKLKLDPALVTTLLSLIVSIQGHVR